jgi:hypothetical protein
MGFFRLQTADTVPDFPKLPVEQEPYEKALDLRANQGMAALLHLTP